MVQHVDAQPGETLRHPPRVRVVDLPDEQLGPHRDDLGPHGRDQPPGVEGSS
jgi:hypothetical protein